MREREHGRVAELEEILVAAGELDRRSWPGHPGLNGLFIAQPEDQGNLQAKYQQDEQCHSDAKLHLPTADSRTQNVVAAEVTRRIFLLSRNPPRYLGGYDFLNQPCSFAIAVS